jgi:hypothetical protein
LVERIDYVLLRGGAGLSDPGVFYTEQLTRFIC